jgi:TonB family protein
MKNTAVAVCLASLAWAVHADAVPSRALAMEYMSIHGIQKGLDDRKDALSKELRTRTPPDRAEKFNQVVASHAGWSAVEDEFVSLIQVTYTAKEIEALIAKPSSGESLAQKNQRFFMAAAKIVQRQAQVLESMMKAELGKGGESALISSTRTLMPSAVSYAVPPKPVYPVDSRRQGEEGVVRLRVLVNATGEAEAVGIQKSSGYPRLDEAALAALAQARFHPYVENGVAVSVYVPASLTFTLTDDETSVLGVKQFR